MQTELTGVLLSAAQYGRSLVHAGEPPSRKITFAVGMSRLPARWRGHDLGPHDLRVLPTSGAEIDLVTQAGYGIATASFPLDLVKATVDNLGLPPIAHGANSLVIPLERSKANMLRALFGTAFSDAVTIPHGDQAANWSVTKQEDLLRILLSCSGNAASKTKSASNCERARVTKAAIAAINDRPGEILSIGDLCRIARASERTLDNAFMERFGLSSALYMKIQRLNGARHELCEEHEPLMSIADVANKWGALAPGSICPGLPKLVLRTSFDLQEKAPCSRAVANSSTVIIPAP